MEAHGTGASGEVRIGSVTYSRRPPRYWQTRAEPTVTQFPWPLQVRQAAPPEPHLPLVVPARQLRPSQQPFGHETASQTQAPPTQRLPIRQASVAPQAQTPPAEQASARIGSQVTHVPPMVPHATSPAELHAPFAQQPVGQD
jgi:hypothetical protein